MKNLNKMKIAPDMQYEIGQDKVGYFPEWSVKDDETLWQKVNKIAHSTYVGDQPSNASPLDPKKYIKVGSQQAGYPIITKDGYLSGCGADHYVQIPVTIGQQPFKVTCRFKIMDAEQALIGMSGEGYASFLKQIGGNVRVTSNAPLSDDTGLGLTVRLNDYVGQYVIAVLEFSGTQYKLSVYTDNGNLINSATKDSSLYLKNISNVIKLGVIADNTPTVPTSTGSLDLKQFSITVDGVEVFSGNKTGIDVIKPTDFTVKTTMYCFKQSTNTIYADNTNADADHIPTELYNADGTLYKQSASGWQIADNEGTITVEYNGNVASYDSTGNITSSTVNSPMVNPPLPWDASVKITKDGMISNGNYSNWLESPTIDFSGDNWEVHIPFIRSSNPSSSKTFFALSGGTTVAFNFSQWAVVEIWDLSAYSTATGGLSNNVESEIVVTPNVTKLYKNGVLSSTIEHRDTTKTAIKTNNKLIIRPNGDIGCIVNLNGVKVYVNNELVYQPMLYIPYTEAELNQKVVDVAYRDRVKDLFEQVGYNGYHTIDEDNKNFTLPTHRFSDVIEHKENGLTVAEQRVDQTLTIRGTCEQGVDVNLPMEFFSDDSYAVFGVGITGTNTASKFTPAADGNYIAIGKGKV